MKNIRMVWFDVGCVLFDYHFDELLEEIGERAHPPLTAHEVYRRIKESGIVRSHDLGQISGDAFSRRLQELLSLPSGSWLLPRWARALQPNQRMWRLATALARNSYRLGIISNTCELHIEQMERIATGAMMRFQPRIYSCREEIAKPNGEIYRIAIECANADGDPRSEKLTAADCVFIDDVLDNIEAARSLGWHGILHNPSFATGTVAELAALGVRV